MISIGIDPDAKGAIVVLDYTRTVLAVHRMPLPMLGIVTMPGTGCCGRRWIGCWARGIDHE